VPIIQLFQGEKSLSIFQLKNRTEYHIRKTIKTGPRVVYTVYKFVCELLITANAVF